MLIALRRRSRLTHRCRHRALAGDLWRGLWREHPIVCTENLVRIEMVMRSRHACEMIALIFLALNLLAAIVKSKSRLEAEKAALRQQLIVLQRKGGRVRLSNDDRLFFVRLYRWFPSILKAMLK
jgi:hypothetical protein